MTPRTVASRSVAGFPRTCSWQGVAAMTTENRLSSEQLAALAPGDSVTIEVSGDFRRPRRSAGAVIRLEASRLVVSTEGARGGVYIEHYSRRDDRRLGGG